MDWCLRVCTPTRDDSEADGAGTYFCPLGNNSDHPSMDVYSEVPVDENYIRENRIYQMEYVSEDVNDETYLTKAEKTELGASMERVTMMLRATLEALIDVPLLSAEWMI